MHRDLRFRQLMDAVPVIIWFGDADGNWLYVNKLWLDFTGRSARHELGQGWADRVHPEDESDRAALLAAHQANGEPFRLEFRLRRHDGVWRSMLCSGVPRPMRRGRSPGSSARAPT